MHVDLLCGVLALRDTTFWCLPSIIRCKAKTDSFSYDAELRSFWPFRRTSNTCYGWTYFLLWWLSSPNLRDSSIATPHKSSAPKNDMMYPQNTLLLLRLPLEFRVPDQAMQANQTFLTENWLKWRHYHVSPSTNFGTFASFAILSDCQVFSREALFCTYRKCNRIARLCEGVTPKKKKWFELIHGYCSLIPRLGQPIPHCWKKGRTILMVPPACGRVPRSSSICRMNSNAKSLPQKHSWTDSSW